MLALSPRGPGPARDPATPAGRLRQGHRFGVTLTTTALALATLAACGGGDSDTGKAPQVFAAPSVALFNPVPANSTEPTVVPFPFDGFFAGASDPTLNIPNAASVPFVAAANQQDGFSTTADAFIDLSGVVDFASVARNLVIVNAATGARLVAGQDFTVQPETVPDATGVPISQQRSRVLIEWLKPLAPSTTYLVGLQSGVTTTQGAGILASPEYQITASATPVSQQPAASGYTAGQQATLEALRQQIVRPVVSAFASLGVPESTLVLAFSLTTESIGKTLAQVAAAATAQPIGVRSTGLNTSQVLAGAPNTADVYAGTTAVPYYSTPATGAQDTGPLTGFWAADTSKPDTGAKFLNRVPCGAYATGATLPDGQTAQPSASTTICYPVPVKKANQTVPVLVTVPNAGSGRSKPANGWPVVIFEHGITGNRSQMLAVAPAMAAAGLVTIAIDQPLHGLPKSSPLRISGVPERTFDLDLQNNTTGASGPDGVEDASGTYYINLSSLLTSRDNLRQSVADLLTLSKSVAALDYNNDGTVDVDPSRIYFLGHSLGGIVGGTFLGVDGSTTPLIKAATLANPGGGVGKLLDASKTFGPRISAGLAASGVVEGTDTYETFLRFAQTLVDAGDPINYAAAASANRPLHLIEVKNDLVVPNAAPAGPASATQDLVSLTGYLSGTDPLIAALGLDTRGYLDVPIATPELILASQARPLVRVAVRFNQGDHGSILSPAANQNVTVEMQREAANFLASGGRCLPLGTNCPTS